MRLTPSDPDVATLIKRMKDGEMDLQPDFQRGEVWSISKQQRLIDSILRDWHVPPIHVIVDGETNKQSVLDGQQRLVSIRAFANDEFTVDGLIQPRDPAIEKLHGLHYQDLPTEWRRRFEQFTMRVFRITDFVPSEPSELFYRLNQPAALTSAEQRNAFYGDTRKQIKALVEDMAALGLEKNYWGFSNARMAYDDILARVALILDSGSLRERVSAASLADKYRSGEPFATKTIRQIRGVLTLLGEAEVHLLARVKWNKAAAQSWLVFLATADRHLSRPFSPESVAEFISIFDATRQVVSRAAEVNTLFTATDQISKLISIRPVTELFTTYEDRSTARVSNTSSVVLRDFVIWGVFAAFCQTSKRSTKFSDGRWNKLQHKMRAWPEKLTPEVFADSVSWGDAI